MYASSDAVFGYVRPPYQELPQEEIDRFRRMYCGLCHTLGKRYGIVARFVLNYDFTFLAILLSGSEEPVVRQNRCIAHPVHAQEFLQQNSAMELAADESVILAYWQLRDGVSDHDWFHGLKYRSLSTVLEPAYRKAALLRPSFAETVRTQLQHLRKLELQRCASVDLPADAFAQLLCAAASEIPEERRRRVLEQMLYHLGRWVYLIDAADDLKKDTENGNYNPVILRFSLKNGTWTPEARSEFAATLDHSIHMIATGFELMNFGSWTQILSATIYTGLFQIGKAVLDGTYHSLPRKENRKKRKNVEEIT